MAEAMEGISRGPVSLLYFTVERDDFANLHPQPPYLYFLVTRSSRPTANTFAPNCSGSICGQ
jgi:hypothetical protein